MEFCWYMLVISSPQNTEVEGSLRVLGLPLLPSEFQITLSYPLSYPELQSKNLPQKV